MAGRHRRGDHRDPQGRYEVRPGPAGLKAIVWIEPGRLALLMTTIAPDRLPLLAEALNDHLRGAEPPVP
jgi:hypothetical protein